MQDIVISRFFPACCAATLMMLFFSTATDVLVDGTACCGTDGWVVA
ncbi:hypothetical protein VU07_01655 [Desulfobulbus sp. F4]|nr:hypothetical protein [Desulfobulbus sp. F4]